MDGAQTLNGLQVSRTRTRLLVSRLFGLTILFMLLTLSVASQLLARAAYMSGAELQLDHDDALSGILDRAAGPSETGTPRQDVER